MTKYVNFPEFDITPNGAVLNDAGETVACLIWVTEQARGERIRVSINGLIYADTPDIGSALRVVRSSMPLQWLPSTRERYWEMLEVLPPALQLKGGFLVGEPSDHNRDGQPTFSAFNQIGEDFFEANRPVTVAQFRELLQ